MELRIDLANHEEVAATVPLLLLILEGAPKACVGGGHCKHEVIVAAEPLPQLTPAASTAPFFVGAAALPIAPVVMPDILAASASVPLPPALSPAAVVPTPPVSAALSSPAVSVELDAAGFPWDARIHSSTKSKVVSGEWKVKRGVSPATITRVEAELKSLMGPDAPPPSHPYPDTAIGQRDPAAVFAQELSPALTAGLSVAELSAPAPPVVSAGDFTPAQAFSQTHDAQGPTTFEQLMPLVAKAVQGNIMPPTAISAACAMYGLTSVVGLQASPSLTAQVWATLQQQYPALQ